MTIKIKPCPEAIDYQAEIDAEDFKALVKAERTVVRIGDAHDFRPLYHRLEEIDGITGAVYTPRIPNLILFTILAERDNSMARAAIAEVIESHLKRCKELLA